MVVILNAANILPPSLGAQQMGPVGELRVKGQGSTLVGMRLLPVVRWLVRPAGMWLGLMLAVLGCGTGCRERAVVVDGIFAQARETRQALEGRLQVSREELGRLANLPAEIREGRGQEGLSAADEACFSAAAETQKLERVLPPPGVNRKDVIQKAKADLQAQTAVATKAAGECDRVTREAAAYLAALTAARAEEEQHQAYEAQAAPTPVGEVADHAAK